MDQFKVMMMKRNECIVLESFDNAVPLHIHPTLYVRKQDIFFNLIHFQSSSNLTRMKLQLGLLLLTCTHVSNVLSIKCQQCISFGITSCMTTQVNCSDQCASASVFLYAGTGQAINVSMQTCSRPDLCINGSLNIGTMNIISNGQCCRTDLCNNQTLSAPAQSPNGLLCYTCDPLSCSRTLKCMGDQDFCISTTVQQGYGQMFMKGCASKSICDMARPNFQGIVAGNAQCCQGNLCNNAESFTMSFILMLVPLLSFILLH